MKDNNNNKVNTTLVIVIVLGVESPCQYSNPKDGTPIRISKSRSLFPKWGPNGPLQVCNSEIWVILEV